MIVGLPIWMALACVALKLIGAAVQGALGIGMAMIAAPLLAIADSGFIPGAIVISVLLYTGGDEEHEEEPAEEAAVVQMI